MPSKTISSILSVSILAALAALLFALPAGAQRANAKATTITVTAGKPSEFGFKLSKKTFPHGTVTFKVTDGGVLPHDFKVCASSKGNLAANACTGKKTATLSPGTTKSLTIVFKTKGTYEYLCTVSGHAAAGMKGLLKVT